MADNPKISQIKLPNGSTYDIKDNTSGYTNNTGTITSVKTTEGAHTTINVSSGAAEFNVPTKTSHLTNDSGYLTASDIASVLTYKGTKASVADLPSTGNTTGDVWHITADGSEYAWDGSIWQELGTTIDLSGYATKATTLAGYGITDAKIENGTITLGSNSITPLTSYTETDPVFSASAAAGITSTDISNWNSKVSDDKTWNGVTLSQGLTYTAADQYIPVKATNALSGTASQTVATPTPTQYRIAKYDNNACLNSTTPSANDNSTKVATTAYVDAAIPDVSGYVSKSGDTMTGKLTLNYNNTNDNNGLVIKDLSNDKGAWLHCSGINGSGTASIINLIFETTGTSNGVYLDGIETPTSTSSSYDKYVVNKKYVDTVIPKVYSSTNTGGYLTMATLPIYDGTVV